VNDKVRHRGTPAEPFATPGMYGRIVRSREDGPLRVTPAARGIPAQAYVDWGDFCTWEKLSDLMPAGGKPKRQ
jgi:hypothetical protein